MGDGALDLIVSGIHTKFAEHIRSKELDSPKTKHQQASPVKEESVRKSKSKTPFKETKKRQTEIIWETESSSSSVSNPVIERPVIWVDIVKKLTVPPSEVNAQETKPCTQKTPSIWKVKKSAQPTLLPDSFQRFLQRNLNLIAEVHIAKRRRSDNRQIFRPQEDNINWTSNAPRPSEWLLKPTPPRTRKRKYRAKKSNHLELPDGLQGTHLKGREPRKNNTLQPRPQFEKMAKATKSQPKPSNDQYDELDWIFDGSRVTIQLPNPVQKQSSKEKRRKRRRTKKKIKVFDLKYFNIAFIVYNNASIAIHTNLTFTG